MRVINHAKKKRRCCYLLPADCARPGCHGYRSQSVTNADDKLSLHPQGLSVLEPTVNVSGASTITVQIARYLIAIQPPRLDMSGYAVLSSSA